VIGRGWLRISNFNFWRLFLGKRFSYVREHTAKIFSGELNCYKSKIVYFAKFHMSSNCFRYAFATFLFLMIIRWSGVPQTIIWTLLP